MTASRTFLAAFAAAAAFVAVPAFAEDAAHTVEVRYGDLDLSSASGAEALKARVARAAKAVCSVEGDKSLKAATAANQCRQIAMAKAMPQVELALAKSGTQLAENARLTVAAK